MQTHPSGLTNRPHFLGPGRLRQAAAWTPWEGFTLPVCPSVARIFKSNLLKQTWKASVGLKVLAGPSWKEGAHSVMVPGCARSVSQSTPTQLPQLPHTLTQVLGSHATARLTEAKEPAQRPTADDVHTETQVCGGSRAKPYTTRPFTFYARVTLCRAFAHTSLYPDVVKEVGILVLWIDGSPDPRVDDRHPKLAAELVPYTHVSVPPPKLRHPSLCGRGHIYRGVRWLFMGITGPCKPEIFCRWY